MADEGETVEVVLTSMAGEHFATLRVEPETTALAVKHMLQDALGYPPESQQLLLQGNIVEDNDLFETLPHPALLTLVLLPFDKFEALYKAVRHGREEAVRNVLFRAAHNSDETSSLLLADTSSRTALQCAAERGHETVCRVLLGAAPDQVVSNRMLLTETRSWGSGTALHLAAWNGHEMACRSLVEFARDAEVQREILLAGTRSGQWRTALHFAAWSGHARACRSLLESALDVEVRREMLLARDADGYTALHRAAQWGHETPCRALLESAPSEEVRTEMLLAKNACGVTAVHMASSEGAHRALEEFETTSLELPEDLHSKG